MDDLITKHDAMEAVRNTPYFDIERALITPEQAMEAIGALDPLHEPSLLEKLRPKGKWQYRCYDRETGITKSYWCPFCNNPRSQTATMFCANCGAELDESMSNKKAIEILRDPFLFDSRRRNDMALINRAMSMAIEALAEKGE